LKDSVGCFGEPVDGDLVNGLTHGENILGYVRGTSRLEVAVKGEGHGRKLACIDVLEALSIICVQLARCLLVSVKVDIKANLVKDAV